MRITFISIMAFVFLVFPNISFGQLEFYKNENSNYDQDNGILNLRFTVKNSGSEDALFSWEIETVPMVPVDWEIASIYDAVVCYQAGVRSNPCEDVYYNLIPAGDSITYYSIGVRIEDAFEVGCITWRLLDACLPEATDTLAEVTCKFDVNSFTSFLNEVLDVELITAFPNPSSDYFGLRNDEFISSISILTITGQEIQHMMHLPGFIHDISSFERGNYLLSLRGMNGKEIKTLLLFKE